MTMTQLMKEYGLSTIYQTWIEPDKSPIKVSGNAINTDIRRMDEKSLYLVRFQGMQYAYILHKGELLQYEFV